MDSSLEKFANSSEAVKRELQTLLVTVSLLQDVGMHFKSNIKVYKIMETDGINQFAVFWPEGLTGPS